MFKRLLLIPAAVLLFACGKPAEKKKPATDLGPEVEAMFAELHMREAMYQLEHGSFLSTGSGEQDMWPPTPPTASARPVNPAPASWGALGMRPPAAELQCSYVAIADAGSGPRIGAKATAAGFAAPAGSWYYLLAECDADGDPASNSFFFSSSGEKVIAEQNPGH